jgi:hypothetical protein
MCHICATVRRRIFHDDISFNSDIFLTLTTMVTCYQFSISCSIIIIVSSIAVNDAVD